jgi:hypothetical protein
VPTGPRRPLDKMAVPNGSEGRNRVRITVGRPDDKVELEVLVRFALPLPLNVYAELIGAIGRSAERLGYTDVGFVYEGPEAGSIAGRPPRSGGRGGPG